jgi:hypothetical protein
VSAISPPERRKVRADNLSESTRAAQALIFFGAFTTRFALEEEEAEETGTDRSYPNLVIFYKFPSPLSLAKRVVKIFSSAKKRRPEAKAPDRLHHSL